MADAESALATLDPQFNPEETALFKEHKPAEVDHLKKQVALADDQVTVLTKESKKAQFEADCLALARDLAQVSSMYKLIEKGERGKRQEKIAHLRSQNVIGASIVSDYMLSNLAIQSGVVKEQLNGLTKAMGLSNVVFLSRIWF